LRCGFADFEFIGKKLFDGFSKLRRRKASGSNWLSPRQNGLAAKSQCESFV